MLENEDVKRRENISFFVFGGGDVVLSRNMKIHLATIRLHLVLKNFGTAEARHKEHNIGLLLFVDGEGRGS